MQNKLAFVFSGQNYPTISIGKELLANTTFKETIHECDIVFEKLSNWKIFDELNQGKPMTYGVDKTMPIVAAIQIALFKLLINYGIQPDSIVGHSSGEVVGAYCSGIISLKDTFKIIWAYSKNSTNKSFKGAMAHVSLSLDEIKQIIKKEGYEDKLFIAAVNSPKATVISGENESVRNLIEKLKLENVFCSQLQISSQFHAGNKIFGQKIFEKIKDIQSQKPSIPFYSSYLGNIFQDKDLGSEFFSDLSVFPIRFEDTIKSMCNDGYNSFLEISPHPILSRFLDEINDSLLNKFKIYSTLDKEHNGINDLYDNINELKKLSKKQITELIINTLKEQHAEKDININSGFFELGLNSIDIVVFSEVLSKLLNFKISHTVLFENSNIEDLAEYLSLKQNQQTDTISATQERKENELETIKKDSPIAVIGMACRFPGGANSIEQFWDILKNGRNAVSDFPDDRLFLKSYINDSNPENIEIPKKANFLKNYDYKTFDYEFFNITPKEAQNLDPQQRLLLEVSWEAFENSGIDIKKYKNKKVGVFIGLVTDDFKGKTFWNKNLNKMDTYAVTGSLFSIASGRLSYYYGFNGPSFTIDSACSSSLVAVNSAINALRNGDCDLALVGSSNILLSPNYFINFTQLNTLSFDGTCKTFDQSADGFGRGEGCGFVVLKRQDDAKLNNDHIKALILGCAVNHGGSSGGLTVPNGKAQKEVYKSALTKAGISSTKIDYIEAHGAATVIGDPIEIQSIIDVYGEGRTTDNPVLVGSVKTNLGHLESTAGMAGLIKVILALQNHQIPPHLNVKELNNYIDWKNVPVRINTGTHDWKNNEKPKYAAISSFALSGTNAHAIIKESEYSGLEGNSLNYPLYLLNISAKSKNALLELASSYINFLANKPDSALGQICYMASVGRTHLDHKLSIIGTNKQEIINKLNLFVNKEQLINYSVKKTDIAENNLSVAFLFTGQGSHYAGMAKELYKIHPVFKSSLDKCDTLFKPYFKYSIVDILYSDNEDLKELINHSIYAQAIIFSIEYALFNFWISIGIKPNILIGHSIGEYTAACVSGIFSLEHVVKIIAERGKLMDNIPQNGEMIGVLTNEKNIKTIISDYNDISIAAVNAAENITISGSHETVSEVKKSIKKKRVFIEKLNISKPYHSVLMKPFQETFRKNINGIKLSPPKIPIVSFREGKQADLTKMDYWISHLSEPVRFYDAIIESEKQNITTFIEIGGTATLTGLAIQTITQDNIQFLASLRQNKNSWEQITQSIRELYLAGFDIKWEKLYQLNNQTNYAALKDILLPTYPFQRKACWPDLDVPITNLKSSDKSFKIQATDNNHSIHMENNIFNTILDIVKQITGFKNSELDASDSLFSIGLDSLMLVQLRKKINHTYNLDITLNLFFTSLNSIQKISVYISENYIPEIKPKQQIEENKIEIEKEGIEIDNQSTSVNQSSTVNTSFKQKIIADQMDIMKNITALMDKQLNSIQNQPDTVGDQTVQSSELLKTNIPTVESPAQAKTKSVNKSEQRLTDFRFLKTEEENLDPKQLQFLTKFIADFNKKTAQSKVTATKHRAVHADWIKTLNYRQGLKELVYPIVSNRSEGNKIWDMDGNEYLDLGMGFGTNYFGYKPDFIVNAVKNQLDKGYELATQSDLAGEVASLISELTGVERVMFTNTGTEACMTAVRLARAVTNRKKIVKFAGAYHGFSDSFLVDGDIENSIPSSPGILQETAEQTIVLNYGSDESLEYILNHSSEIAGVMVEPVQSRRPGFHPAEFLKKLNQITKKTGIAFILDDIYMGFRIHQGGSKAYFDLDPDIALYGKIVGGGFPIGIVSGKSLYLDAIDGGYWNYEDQSYPQSDTVFFAGTFCRHPLSLAATLTTLQFMKDRGPSLQNKVNQKAQYLEEQLNAYFKNENVPLAMKRFGSLFRFESFGPYDLSLDPVEMSLFFYLLIHNGVYTWERRVFALSTVHTFQDMDKVVNAVKKSIETLRFNGFSFNLDDNTDEKPHNNINPVSFPISVYQQGIFTACKMDSGEKPYHIVFAYKVKGKLDINKVEHIFKTLIIRHQSLRSSFVYNQSDFVQIVNTDFEFKLDFKKIEQNEIESTIDDYIKPFDIEKPPLIRVLIAEINTDEYIFVIDKHHIVADGLSINIVFQDFLSLYQNKQLPEIKQQYVDFQKWEEDYLKSQKFETDKTFWYQYINQLQPVNLPIDFNRPQNRKFQGDVIRFELNENITSRLKHLSKENEVSLYTCLLAIQSIFISKISNQENVVFGTTNSLREHGDFDNTIGMFINTVLFKQPVNPQLNFTDFLNKVKQNFLEAYEHQDFPFSNVVEMFQKSGEQNRNPLFDVMFVFENGNKRVLNIEELAFEPINVNLKSAMYDLTVELIEENNKINCNFYYDTCLFKKESIIEFQDFFKNIIETILNSDDKLTYIKAFAKAGHNYAIDKLNPITTYSTNETTCHSLIERQAETRKSDIAVESENNQITYSELIKQSNQLANNLVDPGIKTNDISEEEKEIILNVFNNTNSDYPKDKSIVDLFEEQVEKHPDKIAVYFENTKLSYKELNEEANKVAHYLLEKYDIKSDDFIGIRMHRNDKVLICILGILKSGAAYFPLDMEYPEERIKFMLQDADPALIITTEEFINDDFTSIQKYEKIEIEKLLEDSQKNENCKIKINANSLAYIMYTSGSTGKPKGSLIEQKSVIRLVRNTNYIKINSTDHILQTGSISFDASTFEIWGALLNGASLSLPKSQIDFSTIMDIITKRDISIMWMTSGLFNVAVESKIEMFRYIKTLLVGGDRLSYRHINKVKETFPDLEIINGYGPTENTTFTCCYSIEDIRNEEIPIGKPISNSKVYILDENNDLCPIGVIGELCISGDGLARGYLKREELTNEKFLDNPFVPGEKMYLTGDTGKWLPDGNIAFYGRNDNQFKVSGYRVEIGEIENVLLKHPNIKRALIIPKTTKNNTELFAFYILEDQSIQTELRSFLLQELPYYMIPSGFIEIEQIPLTVNGKIDKVKLIEMVNNSKSKSNETDESSTSVKLTDLQNKLKVIWGEILRANDKQEQQLSIDDDFFELGGNSLKGIQMIAKLEAEDIHLKIGDLFQFRTIKQLSEYVEGIFKDNFSQSELKNIEDALKLKYDSELFYHFMDYQKYKYLILFVDDNIIELKDEIHKFISNNYSISYIPHYILPSVKYHEILKEFTIEPSELLEMKMEVESSKTSVFVPIQNWFIEQQFKEVHHFNNSITLFNKDCFESDLIKQTLKELYSLHDVLNLTLSDSGKNLIVKNFEIDDILYVHENIDKTKITEIIDQFQSSIDLHKGPLWKTILLKAPEGDHVLFIFHQLIMDPYSLRIFVDDFKRIYTQLKNGLNEISHVKSDSFRLWANSIQKYAHSKQILNEYEYWKEICSQKTLTIKDSNSPKGTGNDFEMIEFSIDKNLSKHLIDKIPDLYEIEVSDVILSALSFTLGEILGEGKVLINTEEHGRFNYLENIDIKHTIGWFTAMYPFLLQTPGNKDLVSHLQTTIFNLRNRPANNSAYGALRYMSNLSSNEKSVLNVEPEIKFAFINELNHTDSSEIIISEMNTDSNIGKGNSLNFGILINAIVENKILKVQLSYNKKIYETDLIQNIKKSFKTKIEELTEYLILSDSKLDVSNIEELKNIAKSKELYKFSMLFDTKTNSINKISTDLIKNIKKEDESHYKSIVKNTVEQEFEAAGIQKFFSEKNSRYAGFTFRIKNVYDTAHIKNSFLKTIEQESLLRSTFIKRNDELFIRVFNFNNNISIPVFDVTSVNPIERDKLYYDIINNYCNNEFDIYNSVNYKIFIFIENLKDAFVIFNVDHCISDFSSNDLIQKTLIGNLTNSNLPIKPKKEFYESYLVQLKQGPVGVSEQQIIDELDLVELNKNGEQINKIISSKKVDNLRHFVYTFPMPDITEGVNQNLIWEISLIIFTNLCKYLFELETIPMGIVYHGRSYLNKSYFNTFGLFIDIVPVIVPATIDDPEEIINNIQNKIDFLEQHNINLTSIMYDKKLNKKWNKVASCFLNEDNPAFNMLMFNFLGKRNDFEDNLVSKFEKQAGIEVTNTENELQFGFQFSVDYSEDNIRYKISQCIGLDEDNLRSFFDEQIEMMF